MTEPVLEYVKGEGWVYQQYPTVRFRCGTLARIEPRIPRKGEKYSYAGLCPQFGEHPDKPNLAGWKLYYETDPHAQKYAGLPDFDSYFESDLYTKVTFVKVE